ncbi:MAG: GNAT family N-acetyltransferase [Agriterribacter sp.]
MIKVRYSDKHHVVNILVNAFDDNKSLSYIIPQDGKRKRRILSLMEYSFKVCYSFGKVLLSDDKKACALILLPDKKKTTLRSIWWDVKLIFKCIGIANMRKAMAREAKIKAMQPKQPLCYLWFIGVSPSDQGKGIGGQLLEKILSENDFDKRVVCLETSTLKNIPWYEKYGFVVYDKLDLGYELFFLKRDNK